MRDDLDTYLLIPILFILLFIATVQSRAEVSSFQLPSSNIQKISEVTPESPALKKWSANMTLEYETNLRKSSSPDQDDSTSLILEPVYHFSEKSQLYARMDLIQDFDSERKSSISNTLLVYTPTVFELSHEVQLRPDISITLPTDETLRDEQSYEGSLSMRPALDYTPVAVKGLLFENVLYLNRNLHEYKTRNDYSPNIQYSLRNRVVVSYQFNDKWALALVNDYARSWTYGGYARDAFYFEQQLAYEIAKRWSVTVSQKNEGSVRGPNNNGENVEIFDEKSSYISMGVSHVF